MAKLSFNYFKLNSIIITVFVLVALVGADYNMRKMPAERKENHEPCSTTSQGNNVPIILKEPITSVKGNSVPQAQAQAQAQAQPIQEKVVPQPEPEPEPQPSEPACVESGKHCDLTAPGQCCSQACMNGDQGATCL